MDTSSHPLGSHAEPALHSAFRILAAGTRGLVLGQQSIRYSQPRGKWRVWRVQRAER